jgi:hypothetical protein
MVKTAVPSSCVTPENRMAGGVCIVTAPQPYWPWTYVWRWNNRTDRRLVQPLIGLGFTCGAGIFGPSRSLNPAKTYNLETCRGDLARSL